MSDHESTHQSIVHLHALMSEMRKELEAARRVIEAAKQLVNALTPEERKSEELSPECPNLIAEIHAYDLARKGEE